MHSGNGKARTLFKGRVFPSKWKELKMEMGSRGGL